MKDSGPDELYNFRGHHFKYIAAQYFPYIDFPSRKDDVAVPVNPYDSVDFRLADTMAQKENFTYTIYKEPHTSWGEDTDGVWSGLMGYLQREDVDMSTLVVPTDSRLKAASFTRNYPSDHIIIASLKPQPLPRHLALIRPFTGTVWIAVLLAVLVWVIMFWVLQRLSSRITGSPDLRFDTAFLYGWGVLMEVHPKVPTSATSGQVMVGWWLVFCMVIYTGYESALISHLTVNRASTQPPETFEDLLHADGWEWGLDSWLWTGMPLEYFTRHKDPVVMKIYKYLQIIDPLKGLKKILEGGFSLMTVKSMVTIQGSSYFGDDHGNTPFYISNKNVPIVTFFGWGFRLGAPFYHRFNKLNMQLDAAGILTLWLQKVTTKRIKDNRAKAELDGGTAFVEYTQV
ncbi:hypothetical protein Pmani_002040 [Petrolisthes manimaculis]|uniref:Uncharacterized protein n=1 Tax=Petrolisthes manimaculis TaxID=1843537 RepID=A0AAE1URD9_9EUCA|nr:hypothetical protein Pmani_002040 [Petrolisthes manimaculis]